MIWPNNVDDLTQPEYDLFKAEALLYYQHWSSPSGGEMADLFPKGNQQHHKDGFDKFFNEKMNFGGMTGSEKLVIPGQGRLADLDKGLDKVGIFYGNILEYEDSVDYVINTLGYSTDLSLAYDIPMAFEFKFDSLTQTKIDTLISDIQGNELEFHLSPERGGLQSPNPQPLHYLESDWLGLQERQ